MDWKDALGMLKDDLPPGPQEPDAPAGGAADAASSQPRLDVLLDRKGRKGKEATIIAGFTMSDSEVADLASRLRQKLGTGGSARGGEILLQGDKRKPTLDLLVAWGFKARII